MLGQRSYQKFDLDHELTLKTAMQKILHGDDYIGFGDFENCSDFVDSCCFFYF